MQYFEPSFYRDTLIVIGSTVLRVFIVVALGIVIRWLTRHVLDRAMTARFGLNLTKSKRARTMHVLIKNVARYVIDFSILLTVLQVIGIPISSLLAAAGMVGLAVGFGAQHIVRDLISGFFIVFEDQFSVGDYVTLAGLNGTVEELGLRTIKLRDFSGEYHVVPNGRIEQVTNHSRGAMRVLVQIDVAYEEDLSRVIDVLTRVCDNLAAESEVITDGPKVLGVSELGDSGVSILVWARTLPMEQWGVGRELRLRIKNAFDMEGIEIPYPRRVVVPASATKIASSSTIEGEKTF